MVKLCAKLVDDPSTTIVLLACTEFAVGVSEHAEAEVFASDGFTFVNTTAVHVRAALNRSLGLDVRTDTDWRSH
jgi:hypothetical protein